MTGKKEKIERYMRWTVKDGKKGRLDGKRGRIDSKKRRFLAEEKRDGLTCKKEGWKDKRREGFRREWMDG